MQIRKRKKEEIKTIGDDLGLKLNDKNTSRTILKNLNFEIKKGEFICIIGEVGSGKRLRLEASKNCQKERVNFAKDYEIEKIFKH